MNVFTIIGRVQGEPEIKVFDKFELTKIVLRQIARGVKADGSPWSFKRLIPIDIKDAGARKEMEKINDGDKVAVQGQISGREHEGKYYSSIEVGFGGSIELLAKAETPNETPQPDDDVPF